jgi:hypothetical protein
LLLVHQQMTQFRLPNTEYMYVKLVFCVFFPANSCAVAAAWKPCDLTDVDSSQSEPDSSFFMTGREAETLPDPSARLTPLPADRKIKVDRKETTRVLKDSFHIPFDLDNFSRLKFKTSKTL